MHDIEVAARDNLARVLLVDVAATDLELDADLADEYGLTSLNKVLFLTAACDDGGVELSSLTEQDVGRMRTLRDVIEILGGQSRTAA